MSPDRAKFDLTAARDHFSTLRHGSPSGDEMGAAAQADATVWVDVMQEAGDILWLPSQWEHTTISLTDSVAVAIEYV